MRAASLPMWLACSVCNMQASNMYATCNALIVTCSPQLLCDKRGARKLPDQSVEPIGWECFYLASKSCTIHRSKAASLGHYTHAASGGLGDN